MHFFHTNGGDDDKKKENGDLPDPVIDANDLGAEGVRFGEGQDPAIDEAL